jgi:hypothetical protein
MVFITRDEIDGIVSTPYGLVNINYILLDDAREVFHSVCGIYTRGRNLSSPNFKVRREAFIRLFESFQVDARNGPVTTRSKPKLNVLSYSDVANGLRTLGRRWSIYSTDELLSVAILMDVGGHGCFTFEEFFKFSQIVSDSLKQEPANSVKCFDVLFECLKERMKQQHDGLRARENYLMSADLEDKLAEVVKTARRNGILPLRLLYSYVAQYGADLDRETVTQLLRRMGAKIEGEDDSSENENNNRDLTANTTNGLEEGDGFTGLSPLHGEFSPRIGMDADSENAANFSLEAFTVSDSFNSATKSLGTNMKVIFPRYRGRHSLNLVLMNNGIWY